MRIVTPAHWSCLIPVFASLWMVSNVNATTFFERPFAETVQEATAIVRGKIGTSYADWGKGSDGSRRIYTYYDLQLDEVFKGSGLGSSNGVGSIVIRELGGEKDGVGMQVSGSAQFERGEDVVVMLGAKNTDGSYDLRSLMMGKYEIQKDADGKEYLVGAGMGSGILSDPRQANGDGKEGQGGPPTQWTLELLRQLVKSQSESRVSNPELAHQKAKDSNALSSSNKSANSQAPQLQSPTPVGSDGSKGSDSGKNNNTLLGLLSRFGVLFPLVGLLFVIWAYKRRQK